MTNQNVNPFTGEPINEVAVATRKNAFEEAGFSLSNDVTSVVNQFTTMKAETPEQKVELFNAINNPENRLSDCINMTIKVKDLYIEVVECTNDETGEVTSCPRIVIIDDEGKSYQCVSVGIYSALKKAIQIFGAPTWHDPIPFMVKQVTKGNRKMLTLNVAK